MTDGVIIQNGTIAAVIHGVSNQRPDGFTEMDITGLRAGQPLPAQTAPAAPALPAGLSADQLKSFIATVEAFAASIGKPA